MGNAINQIDAYKIDHRRQYPEGTEKVYSNLTARSDKIFLRQCVPEFWDGRLVVFGIQSMIIDFLMKEWDETFFFKPKYRAVIDARRRIDSTLGPDNDVSDDHISALHDLGYLPILIKALPEGSRVNMRVPFFTITNTKPEFFWLVNYLETVLSSELWKPSTCATIAHHYRRMIDHYAEKTGCVGMGEDFQCHDFSMRGMSGRHDAAHSGMGHLLSFLGTDTIPAVDAAEDFYAVPDEPNYVYGCSVPATEHSVMCMGTKENEIETFRRMLKLYPKGIVSIVSDTWDYWKVLTETIPALKDEIMARDVNFAGLQKTVIRPDSGDPADIICGAAKIIHLSEQEYNTLEETAVAELERIVSERQEHGRRGPDVVEAIFEYDGEYWRAAGSTEWNRFDKQFYVFEGWSSFSIGKTTLSPAEKGSLEILWEIFGGTYTETGHRVLDPHIGLIYGDSITMERCHEILRRMEEKGFASCNVVFGVGSFTYQYNTRDTFGMAMKATYGEVHGQPREIFKDPATGDGIKKSARGLVRVEKVDHGYVLYDQQTPEQEQQGELIPYFKDGKLLVDQTFEEIRARLKTD